MAFGSRPEKTLIDTFGCPEYFTTHMHFEKASHGMVRVIRSIERIGVIVPLFSYVTPAHIMIRNGPMLRDFAEDALLQEMAELGRH